MGPSLLYSDTQRFAVSKQMPLTKKANQRFRAYAIGEWATQVIAHLPGLLFMREQISQFDS
jgi:hypothetical protein